MTKKEKVLKKIIEVNDKVIEKLIENPLYRYSEEMKKDAQIRNGLEKELKRVEINENLRPNKII